MVRRGLGLLVVLAVICSVFAACTVVRVPKTQLADASFVLSDKKTILDKEQRREKALY